MDLTIVTLLCPAIGFHLDDGRNIETDIAEPTNKERLVVKVEKIERLYSIGTINLSEGKFSKFQFSLDRLKYNEAYLKFYTGFKGFEAFLKLEYLIEYFSSANKQYDKNDLVLLSSKISYLF